MAKKDFNPYAVAFLESFDALDMASFISSPTAPAKYIPQVVDITVDEPNRVVIQVEHTEGGYLVLTDADYPAWRATVDGEPVTIHRANVAFRAVWVPSGKHRVEFRFQSRTFGPGIAVSVMTLLAVCLVWLAGRLKSKRGKGL